MSQEVLAIIRSGYDAVNRRDFEHAASLLTEDFELEIATTNRVYRGAHAFRRLYQDLLDAFGEYLLVIEEMIDAGEHVVVVVRIELVGRGSGVPLAHPAAHVWTLQNGQVRRCKGYLSRQDALAAVGLGPSAG